MIFYFSGTGNSLQVAERIAKRTHDNLSDIGALYKKGSFSITLRQGEDLGFVFPTYAWTTPKIVDEFIRKLKLTPHHGPLFKPAYCYAVVTCGMFVGNTARYFEKELLRYQGIKLNASFSVQSVGTCVYMYNPASGDKRKYLLEESRRETMEAAHLIKDDRWENKENRNPFGIFMSQFTCRDEKHNSIEPFHVTDACVGCGICTEICPTNTISLVEGKPIWSGDDCTQCLACLHRCPLEASQYGSHTQKRGRFTNPALADQTQANLERCTRFKEAREKTAKNSEEAIHPETVEDEPADEKSGEVEPKGIEDTGDGSMEADCAVARSDLS